MTTFKVLCPWCEKWRPMDCMKAHKAHRRVAGKVCPECWENNNIKGIDKQASTDLATLIKRAVNIVYDKEEA